jgi:hypothetical protein
MEYFPVTCLVRFNVPEIPKLLLALRAGLDVMGTVEEGSFTADASMLHGETTTQKWLRVRCSEVDGPLLYNYNMGSPLVGGQLEGMVRVLSLAGVTGEKAIAALAGRVFVGGGWRIGLGVLNARGRERAVVLSLVYEAHRSRRRAPQSLFMDMTAQLCGSVWAQVQGACSFSHHDTTPPVPTAATMSAQFNQAHYCVEWVTLLQPEIKEMIQSAMLAAKR